MTCVVLLVLFIRLTLAAQFFSLVLLVSALGLGAGGGVWGRGGGGEGREGGGGGRGGGGGEGSLPYLVCSFFPSSPVTGPRMVCGMWPPRAASRVYTRQMGRSPKMKPG